MFRLLKNDKQSYKNQNVANYQLFFKCGRRRIYIYYVYIAERLNSFHNFIILSPKLAKDLQLFTLKHLFEIIFVVCLTLLHSQFSDIVPFFLVFLHKWVFLEKKGKYSKIFHGMTVYFFPSEPEETETERPL